MAKPRDCLGSLESSGHIGRGSRLAGLTSQFVIYIDVNSEVVIPDPFHSSILL